MTPFVQDLVWNGGTWEFELHPEILPGEIEIVAFEDDPQHAAQLRVIHSN